LKLTQALEKALSCIHRHAMLEPASGVVVAVSGGADSVALLDILLRLRSVEEFSGIRLMVAHLDHQLRGEESTEDAEFVRALAHKSGLDFAVKAIDVKAEAKACGRGLEETAREIRYKFLLDTARQSGCDRIATGHTMNDQAETFLMRLARGSALRGLSCMRPFVPAHQFSPSAPPLPRSPAPLLIRPLLLVTRDEVEEHCRAHGLEFQKDATNLNLDYARNRARHRALPALCEINPRAVEAIARAAEIIADEEDALTHLAIRLLDESRIERENAYSIAAMIAQPRALRRRMMIEAIGRAGSTGVGSKHVAALERLLESAESGARVQLPGRIEAWREFDGIAFRIAGETDDYQFEMIGECSMVEAGGLLIVAHRRRPTESLDELMEEARRERKARGRDWMMAILDDRRLPDVLIVRPRQRGERAGVAGIKKLKSMMIDHRIPASRRSLWPVVATPDGQYVWSPGLPPARQFAPGDETSSLAILRADEM
jgi:tRNA(Ile)-lysidine synthase